MQKRTKNRNRCRRTKAHATATVGVRVKIRVRTDITTNTIKIIGTHLKGRAGALSILNIHSQSGLTLQYKIDDYFLKTIKCEFCRVFI